MLGEEEVKSPSSKKISDWFEKFFVALAAREGNFLVSQTNLITFFVFEKFFFFLGYFSLVSILKFCETEKFPLDYACFFLAS